MIEYLCTVVPTLAAVYFGSVFYIIPQFGG